MRGRFEVIQGDETKKDAIVLIFQCSIKKLLLYGGS